MMPGIGFAEMMLLALVAIVVIGPKELPLMMRKFGRFTGKMRALAFEFKQGFDELGRQAELEELRKEVADLKKHTGMEDLQKDLEEDRANLNKDIDSAMSPAALPPSPPVPNHAGLSADHPGYDTGENYRIDGPTPAASAPVEPTPPASPAAPAPAAPQPVKQDASA